MKPRWAYRALRVVGMVILGAILLLAAAFGFGISGRDVERIQAFATAVGRWQNQPDFRRVEAEYVELGVGAMRAKVCGVAAADLIMAFRSLPGLPPSLRVAPTSAAHYRAFGRGELSAYLHLAGEQGIGDGVTMFEKLGERPKLEDADALEFLHAFRLPFVVASDAGARSSVRSLSSDVQPSKPLVHRSDLAKLFEPHIRALASRVDIPADPKKMSFDQQHTIYIALDDYVRQVDPETWRTKQIGDFLSGIWAQGYGQVYLNGIVWAMRLRLAGRIICGAAVMCFVGMLVRRQLKKKPTQNGAWASSNVSN